MATMKVKYVGLSDIREITVNQLAAVGVTVDRDMVWTRRTILDPIVYLESPSDELLEVLKAEGTFVVEEVDAATKRSVGDELVKSEPSKADDTDKGKLIDGNTGADVSAQGR